jgi:hypothetical protein
MMQKQLVQTKQEPQQKAVQRRACSKLSTQVQDYPYLQMQGIIGNHGVLRHYGIIQAKLSLGSPNNRYEQEAERMAKQVINVPETDPWTSVKPIQFKGTSVFPEFESCIGYFRSGGYPLPESVRSFFELRFGCDFTRVRIHTDARAMESARSAGAQAFTLGRDIVFGAGQYRPETESGRKLIAHELTHVIQQELHTPMMQFALPSISAPTIPALSSIDSGTRQHLLNLVETFSDAPSVTSGRAAVNAVVSWLESVRTVQYTGQSDIHSGSPVFRMRPSMRANESATREGVNLSNTRGYTYPSGPSSGIHVVEIYPRAFMGDSHQERLSFLIGTIVHEYIHILQNRVGGTQTIPQREFQAWLWEAENIMATGIQPRTATARQIAIHLELFYTQLNPAERTAYQTRYTAALSALRGTGP